MAKPKTKPEEEIVLICRSPRASKRFDIDERIEAGLVLMGSEVKSMRARKADLEGAYASIDQGELWLHKMHIAPYEQAGAFGHEPKRSRKLLIKRAQLERLQGKLTTKGYALVPLEAYFKKGWAKVQLGLGKGRKAGDRREDMKRDVDMREAREAMERSRG